MEILPMLHCDTVKEMLSNFLEDTIEPDLKAQIQTHLEACNSCNEVFIQVQTITKRLQTITSIKTSSNFDQRLRAQIINDRIAEKPVINIRNISYGLSGLAVIVGVYIISTADILKFDNSMENIQPQQTISNSQPVQSNPGVIQPASETGDVLAVDTLKNASPSNIEDRDLQLIENR
jgi:hypothetical protein